MLCALRAPAPAPVCLHFSVASLAAQPNPAQLAVRVNLVRQLVINSPCTHSLGRVLLAWVQRTLEKRHLSRVLISAGPELG